MAKQARIKNIYFDHLENEFNASIGNLLLGDSTLVLFNDKLNSLVQCHIDYEREKRLLKTTHNPVHLASKIAAKFNLNKAHKDLITLFVSHASAPTTSFGSYTARMFKYFEEHMRFYTQELQSYEENWTVLNFIKTHISVCEEISKTFVHEVFVGPNNDILKNMHRTSVFLNISQAISHISEIFKADEMSRIDTLKRYSPDQIDKFIFSQSSSEITNKTISALKPHVRALYSFYKKTFASSENSAMSLGQMLFYIDTIEKSYSANTTSNIALIKSDAKAKVNSCKLAKGIFERHFKYFATSGYVYPIDSNVAIENFTNCLPYTPQKVVKPVGKLSKPHASGVVARPRVKITLTEKETNIDGPNK